MITHSPKQTQAIAAKLAKNLRGGEVIALQGELGSGKTTFVQGLASALGVRRATKSPTFVLVQTYQLGLRGPPARYDSRRSESGGKTRDCQPKTLCHVDAYRLNNNTDQGDLGLRDCMGQKDTVTVIEWPERINNILPKKTIWIRFAHGKKENERMIEMKHHGLTPVVWRIKK